jgi:hypothetical protein
MLSNAAKHTHTPMKIIYNRTILNKKEAQFRLFLGKICFILTFGYKLKSNIFFRTKASFWASFLSILINVLAEKNEKIENFLKIWVF